MSGVDLIALSADDLATLVRTWGWPRSRARQILRWLYRARLTDIAAMTDLSHADRTRLAAEACIGALAPSTVLTSEDGTRKFIFSLERSEEHTSELQSQSNLVCRLLLEKKKKKYRCLRLLPV